MPRPCTASASRRCARVSPRAAESHTETLAVTFPLSLVNPPELSCPEFCPCYHASGSSHTTSPETKAATACAYPRRSSPRSEMSDAGIPHIAVGPEPSSTPSFSRRPDSGNHQANEHAEENPRRLPQKGTTHRIPRACGDSRSRQRDGLHSRPSQHIVTTRANRIPYSQESPFSDSVSRTLMAQTDVVPS